MKNAFYSPKFRRKVSKVWQESDPVRTRILLGSSFLWITPYFKIEKLAQE